MNQRRISAPAFMLGDWLAYPRHGFIENDGQRVALEPKLFDVLVLLVEREGDVVSIDELLDRCWAGDFYGDNPVHKAIAMLRKALGDDAKAPRYVATVRKRGYRLVTPVVPVASPPARAKATTGVPVESHADTLHLMAHGLWTDSPQGTLELARAMDAIGLAFLRTNRVDLAVVYFKEAIVLKKRVLRTWSRTDPGASAVGVPTRRVASGRSASDLYTKSSLPPTKCESSHFLTRQGGERCPGRHPAMRFIYSPFSGTLR